MKHLVSSSACCLAALLAVAAPPLLAFERQWPIELLDQQVALQRIHLPIEAYAWVRDPQLRDIVVRDSQGSSLPAALEPPRRADAESWEQSVAVFPLPPKAELGSEGLRAVLDGRSGELSVQVEVTGAVLQPAPAVAWLLDLGEDAGFTESLRLDSEVNPLVQQPADWSARISIEDSADLQSWQGLVAGHDLYRIEHQGHRLGVLDVALTRVPRRYLRWRWEQGTPPPEPRLIASKRRIQVEPPADAELLLVASAASDAAAWQFTLPGPLLVRALALEFDNLSWLAQANWLSRANAEQPWAARGSNEVYRLQAAGAMRLSPALHLAPSRDPQWRVSLLPDVPSAPRLRVTVTPDRLVFAPSGNPPYRLLIGSKTQRRVDAPFGGLLGVGARAGEELSIADARLGQSGEVATVDRDPVVHTPTDWKRPALWGALALGVLLVAGMVRTLLRESGSAAP